MHIGMCMGRVSLEKGMEAFKKFKKKWQKSLEYAYENLHIKK